MASGETYRKMSSSSSPSRFLPGLSACLHHDESRRDAGRARNLRSWQGCGARTRDTRFAASHSRALATLLTKACGCTPRALATHELMPAAGAHTGSRAASSPISPRCGRPSNGRLRSMPSAPTRVPSRQPVRWCRRRRVRTGSSPAPCCVAASHRQQVACRRYCGGVRECGARTVTGVCLQTKPEVGSYYIDRVRKAFHANAPGIEPQFEFFPIVDQNVASDDQTAMLALRLYRRLEEGEALYIHCRGGHGRTGTVCALLLGLVFDLAGPEALALYPPTVSVDSPSSTRPTTRAGRGECRRPLPIRAGARCKLLRADGDDAPMRRGTSRAVRARVPRSTTHRCSRSMEGLSLGERRYPRPPRRMNGPTPRDVPAAASRCG